MPEDRLRNRPPLTPKQVGSVTSRENLCRERDVEGLGTLLSPARKRSEGVVCAPARLVDGRMKAGNRSPGPVAADYAWILAPNAVSNNRGER